MTLITNVGAAGLINQLADEYVTTYSADNLTITQIVTALLAFQVLAPAITVGTIDPTVSRSIKVDGDTILRALYRLRDTVGGHIYVDSDRALQWRTTIGENKGQQIRYRKNLKGITREIDYTTLTNRLYAYGAGEGDARIKLSDAEGHSEDYVEDGTSQTEWGGIYIKVIVDKSITHPDTLLAWANLRLAEIKDPRIAYRVATVDLSESMDVDFSFEALQIGSTITIIDEDLGVNVSAQVVKITHPDLLHPELMEIEVANRTKDISDVLGQVYDVQQLAQHVATQIGAGQVTVKGAFTVIDWVTEGETTIVGSNIETGTITALQIEALTITAAEIAAGTITADKLSFTAYIIGTNDLDDIADGSTYEKVKATDISAGHIKLSSVTVIDGEWYDESGVEIDAAHGVNIYGVNNALTTRATKTGTIQCSVDAAGRIVAGAGSVELSSTGINIFGAANALTTRATRTGTIQCSVDAAGRITAGAGHVIIDANGINIWGLGNALTTRATESGTIQCYVGADGKLYAGAGNVVLDVNGIDIKGAFLGFRDSGGVVRGSIFGSASYGLHIVGDGGDITLDPDGFLVISGHTKPINNGICNFGAADKRFNDGYINKLYVATEMYIPAEA